VRAVVSLVVLAAALVACAGDGGDLDAFCAQARDTGQLDEVFDTYDPSDVEGTAAQFAAALEAYESLRSDAPAEVRDDLDVLIDFTTEFRDSLLDGDPSDPGTTTQVGLDLEERFAEVEAATNELEVFVANNCVGA
jgi:dihydrodipicolinate reductase